MSKKLDGHATKVKAGFAIIDDLLPSLGKRWHGLKDWLDEDGEIDEELFRRHVQLMQGHAKEIEKALAQIRRAAVAYAQDSKKRRSV